MVRHYVRKRTFSTPDRVLIHLSTDDLRPEEQTQDGIAAATRSGRSTLTKWLRRFEASGLVTRERVRLPGHPLPKYAYRLSETGWQRADRLRQRLASEVVTVRAPNLGELAVRISEVPSLASARLDLTGALAAVHNGELNLSKVATATRKRGPVVWGGTLRRVDRFFGRSEELRNLDAWWASDSQVLLLTGLAGIGKSTLAAAWVQGRKLGAPVYGFEIRRSVTPSGFLSDLGGFLVALGKPSLAAHLAQGVPLNREFVSRLLERDLAGRRVLVVIDNADQANADVGGLVDRLLVRWDRKIGVKTILVGRRLPRWLKPSLTGKTGVEVQSIQGLDSGASTALLRSRGIGPDSGLTQEILRRTRGHPLLLHLAASSGTGRGSAVQRYLESEVWGSLASGERSVLEAASLFRKPTTQRNLASVARADVRTLERLVDRNLLERTVSGGYVMHDLVREFVATQLSDSRRRSLHGRAAELLLRATDSRERWEGIYHLLEAGKAAEAGALLEAQGASLLDSVAAEEIASLVRDVILEETDPATYCTFAEILGDSLRIRGHVAPALFQYGHAQRLAENSGKSDRVPRILRKMAFLERCRNRYARALGYLVEAHARLLLHGNPTEMIEVLREMALAEQALGASDKAAQHLNEAVDLATDLPDRAALSRTLLALGSLESQRGHRDLGLASDLEGLRAAERSGNLTEIAHSHIVVGAALIGMGRSHESLRHLAEGFEASRLLGNLRLMGYATANQTSALLHVRRYKDVGRVLQQAKDCFEVLEEKDTVGFLKTYEGELEMELGHWSRATALWQEGLRELRVNGSPADLALVLRDVAGFYSRHGDTELSRSHLLEAREIARKVGNEDLVLSIDSDLSLLQAPSGRYSVA